MLSPPDPENARFARSFKRRDGERRMRDDGTCVTWEYDAWGLMVRGTANCRIYNTDNCRVISLPCLLLVRFLVHQFAARVKMQSADYYGLIMPLLFLGGRRGHAPASITRQCWPDRLYLDILVLSLPDVQTNYSEGFE